MTHVTETVQILYLQVLMNSNLGLASELPDVRMVTAKGYPLSGDVVMDTAKADTTVKHLRLWQKELLESAEVKRKATVAQLCEFRPWLCSTWS